MEGIVVRQGVLASSRMPGEGQSEKTGLFKVDSVGKRRLLYVLSSFQVVFGEHRTEQKQYTPLTLQEEQQNGGRGWVW